MIPVNAAALDRVERGGKIKAFTVENVQRKTLMPLIGNTIEESSKITMNNEV